MVVTAMIWRWLYNSDFGVINYLLKSIGLGPVKWLASPSIALMSIMIMMIWMTMGYRILMLSTGLNNIPNDYYEAAVVDGANKVQLFFHITIPLLQPVLFFVFVTSIIASFQVFDPIWIMTQGGPLGSTEVLVYRIYKEAWEHLNMGYAAAQSWGLFMILFFFTWLQFRFMGRDTVRY